MLAKTYGLSERSFFRHWSKYYPQSPTAMIRKLKLEYAKKCLAYTDIPISTIAGKLGFCTVYFDRQFKQETDITPK